MTSGPARKDALAFAPIAAGGVILLNQAFRPGRALDYRDIYLFWHAQVETAVPTVAAGVLPVWDPNASFGESLLNGPSGLPYPTMWLNLLMQA